MRILVADHHKKVLMPLRMLIAETTEHEVIAEVRDWETLIKEIKKTSPDLVLLEWELPGCSRENCVAALRTPDNQPKIVVLSTNDEAKMQSLEAGADAFVSKGDSPLKLLETIQAVTKD